MAALIVFLNSRWCVARASLPHNVSCVPGVTCIFRHLEIIVALSQKLYKHCLFSISPVCLLEDVLTTGRAGHIAKLPFAYCTFYSSSPSPDVCLVRAL